MPATFLRLTPPRWVARTLAFLLTWLQCVPPSFAAEFTVFKKTYVRKTGAPVTETDTFRVVNPNVPYLFRAANGSLEDTSIEKVSSSSVELNDAEVLQPSHFNQNVSLIEAPVTLRASNIIEMQLRSKPDGQLTIEIIGQDDHPPVLSWLAPQADAIFDATPETVTVNAQLRLSDDIAGIDPKSLLIRLDGVPITDSLPGLPAPTLEATLETQLSLGGGLHTLTAEVRDLAGQLGSAAVRFRINRAPVASEEIYNLDEDTGLTVPSPGVLANDQDPDIDPLSAVLVSGPSHGMLTFNGDGSFSYTPAANFHGPDQFAYQATDGRLPSDITTVALTVQPVNDPPVAVDDSYEADEDTPLAIADPGVLQNDTDVDEDLLHATLIQNVAHGTLILNAHGGFDYTPAPNFNGEDRFTYQTTDGQASSNVAQATIRVRPVNDPPTASAGQDEEVFTGDTVHLDGSASSDPDGDALTYHWEIIAAPHNSIAVLSNPTSANPSFAPDLVGSYDIRLTVADPSGTIAHDTVRVSAASRNKPPIVDAGLDQTLELEIDPSQPFHVRTIRTDLYFPGPIRGIAHHAPTKRLLVSASDATGALSGIELVAPDGTRTRLFDTSLIPVSAGALGAVRKSLGGFTEGEFFVTMATIPQPAMIIRVSADGATVQNPWVALPGEDGAINTLYHDPTGIFGGDLIALTNNGHVWRISASGATTRLQLSTGVSGLVGAVVVPNDPERYGPLAGKLLVGAPAQTAIHTIDSAGQVTPYFIANPSDIAIVPPHEHLFGLDNADPRRLRVVPASVLAGLAGDIIIAQNNSLRRLVWDGTKIDVFEVAPVPFSDIEFSPTGLLDIPAVKLLRLRGAATDDGLPLGGALTASWSKVSGPGEVTLTDPAAFETDAGFGAFGSYVLRLAVSDSELTGADEVSVAVEPSANQPPVANAGSDFSVELGQPALVDGGASSDPNGDALTYHWSLVSAPGGSTLTVSLGRMASFSFSPDVVGSYVFELIAFDGQLFSEPARVTITGTRPSDCTRVYTTDADFDTGALLNVTHAPPHSNQLRLSEGAARPFPFVNVAASLRGTMVRINVRTGSIMGEYLTGPDGLGRNPSRTTVDLLGNVWVANRDGEGPSGGRGKGSVVRVGLVVGGTRTDADGTPNAAGAYLKPPFQYNTCRDRDGDGLLKTSRGLAHILPWANAGGVDTHGGVSTAEDECLINFTRVVGTGTRTVAVDANNDVWVGGSSNMEHEKLDGVTGQPIPGTQYRYQSPEGSNFSAGGYGGLIDANGILWSARGLARIVNSQPEFSMLRLDPKTMTGISLGYTTGYGLAVDPQTNHIWLTGIPGPLAALPEQTGHIFEIDPLTGSTLNTYGHGNPFAQGVVVDGKGNVWVAHSLSGFLNTNQGPAHLVGPQKTVGHLRTDGTYVGNVTLPGGVGPTGVAVDVDGKVWVTNFYSSNVMRIDPNAGPIGGGGFPIGKVDMTVDLGPGANPYNYSDMTGFVLVGTTHPQGTWSVIHDSGMAATPWGRVFWNTEPEGIQPPGTTLRVEARAADQEVELSTQPYLPVSNGPSVHLTGRFIEVRATLEADPEGISPVLSDMTIGCSAEIRNVPPAAKAGQDRQVRTGTSAPLDGSASFDPDGDALTYRWSIASRPNGSTAALSGADAAIASLTPDRDGDYVLELVVNDGHADSAPDRVTLTAAFDVNNRPVANISETVTPGPSGSLVLDGSASSDPDGDAITFAWSFVAVPAGSAAVLNGATTSNPSFVPDVRGEYVVRLVVNDGQLNSAPVEIVIGVANRPPVALAGPDVEVPSQNTTVELSGSGFDPDGDPLTFRWTLLSKPSGSQAVLSDPTLPNPQFLADVAGDYVLQLVVNDGQVDSAPDTITITVNFVPPNLPPKITSQAIFTATVGQLYVYDVEASDPENDPLTFSLTRAPAGMTIDPITGVVRWTPAAAEELLVIVTATDTHGNTGTQEYALTVREPANAAPQFTSTPITAAQVGVLYAYDADATDPEGQAVTFSLGMAPAGMTIQADTGLIQWSPLATQTGTHTVVVTATDSLGASANQGFVISVALEQPVDRSPPVVELGITPPANPINPFDLVTIQYRTTDNVGVVFQQLTINGTPTQSTPNPVDATIQEVVFSSPDPGAFLIVATARDAAGNESSDSFVLLVRGPDDAPPTVAITAPLPQSDPVNLPQVVLTQPTDILGTVDDTNLAYYTLSYSPVGQNAFREFARGTTPVPSPGVLGRLDTTLLDSGFYEIRLEAIDINGQEADPPASQIYGISSDLKIGHFGFSEQDLIVPVTGLPLAVIRTHNSLNPRIGDFGHSWTMSLSDVQFELNEDRIIVEDADTPEVSTFSLRDGGGRDVAITLPDGRRTVFTFGLTPGGSSCACFHATWTPAAGVHATLRPTISDKLIVLSSQLVFWEGDAAKAPSNQQLPIQHFDFPGFILTMTDGTEYLIEREDLGTHFALGPSGENIFVHAYGKGHLKSITDRNGNTITITPAGLLHSDGPSVAFNRDAQGRITSITDPAGRTTVEYAYSSEGDLIAVTRLVDAAANKKVTTTYAYKQRNGRSTHIIESITSPTGKTPLINEYDASGRLIASVDAFGKRIVYNHDLAARQEIVTDRRGFQTVYAYNAQGDVTDITNAEGETAHHDYDANRNIIATTVAFGTPLAFTRHYEYDSQGEVIREHYTVDGQLIETRYTYVGIVGAHLLASVTDPIGTRTENTYDALGNLTETLVKDKDGALLQRTQFSYDGQGRLIQTTDHLETKSESDYDAAGNAIETRIIDKDDNQLSKSTFVYDANGNVLIATQWKKDASGSFIAFAATRNDYDAQNRLVKVTDPLNFFTQTIYTDDGQVFQQIDKKGTITESRYDELGQLIETIYAKGKPEEAREFFSYDANGNRKTTTDRGGHVTEFAYDGANRLIKTTRLADGSFTETDYDEQGRVKTSTDALGHVTTYEYDLAGRRTKVIPPLPNGHAVPPVMEYTYDDAGRVKTFKDALNHVTTYEYDALGRQVKTIFHDLTFTETFYDALGRRIKQRDQAGIETGFEYDPLGRLTAVIQPQVEHPTTGQMVNPRTEYTYDELGNQLTQKDAEGRITRFEYDELNRRVIRDLPLRELHPTRFREIFAYDDNGNLDLKTDFNKNPIKYSYDALNRLRSKDYGNNGSLEVEFTYMPNGLRETMRDPSGVTTYGYDARDRLITKATPQGTLSYTYDVAGNLLTIRSNHANGVNVVYAYDELNRLKRTTDGNLPQGDTTYTYDDVGNLNDYTYPNGVVHRYAYDDLNRLTELRVNNGSAVGLASYTYALGPAGNRLSVTELSGRFVEYGYDKLYRLTSETITGAVAPNPNGQITYRYDLVGNRLERTSTVAGVPTTSSLYDENDRLKSDTYDDSGNTIGSGDNTDAYDAENRLIDRNSGQIRIVYDGDGNRVAKTVGGVTTQYLVDTLNPTGYAQVVEELVNGSLQRVYTYGHDLISQRQHLSGAWTPSFYLYDGHGNVRFLTNTSGAITDTYDYDAYGIETTVTSGIPNHYRYTGEQFDSHLILSYLRSRYLDLATGRFLTMDIYEGDQKNPTMLHKYAFSNSDPVNRTDPSGRISLLEVNVFIGVLPIFAQLSVATVPSLGRCGPDVTNQVKEAVKGIKDFFGGLSPDKQKRTCDALTLKDGLKQDSTGEFLIEKSWDIKPLHESDWVQQPPFNATCPNGNTIAINGECSYAGSVNYVMYGVLSRLCGRTASEMELYVNAYKFLTQGDNWKPAKEWAVAGYNGWPDTAPSPKGDRPGCSSTVSYKGRPFGYYMVVFGPYRTLFGNKDCP